jgi:tetratricopeptide (TPR) repeat protein
LQTLEQARAHQRGDDRTVDKALADALMLAGRYEAAIEAYRRVLAVGSQAAVELNVAEALIRLGRTDEARQQIQQVTTSGTAMSPAQQLVAELLRASMLDAEAAALAAEGRNDEAERKAVEQRRVLEATQRLDPTNPVPSVHRAQSLLSSFRRTGQSGLLDDALLALSQAESLRANFPAISAVRADVHLAKGDRRRAIDELQRTIQLQPENASARQTLVALHMRDNDTEGAIEVVRAAVELNPTIAAFHEQLVDLHVTKGDFPAAIESFTRAYEIDALRGMLRKLVLAVLSAPSPSYSKALALLNADKESLNDPVLRSFYAVTLNGMDQREEAVAQLHRAYREMRTAVVAGGNAADWGSWFFAARRFFSGSQPSAIESLVMELSEGKPNPEELYQLGVVWRESGPDGLQRAFELQKQVVAQCPPDNSALLVDLNFILSRYAIGVRDFAAAAAALEVVVRERPDHAVALNDLAYLLAEELGQAERARPFAEKAVSMEPRRASMLDTLGVVYHRLGMQPEAERRLGEALAIEPNAETYKHLAQVLIAQGRPADAERQLRRGLDMKPSPAVQQEITRLLDDIKAGKP